MNFMKFRYYYLLFSLTLLLPGMICLGLFGLRASIDFTGGSLFEISFEGQKPASFNQSLAQESLGSSYELTSVQESGSHYILRGKPIDNSQKDGVLTNLGKKFGVIILHRFETVGPLLGKELLQKTLVAGLIAAAFIIIYIWQQFHSLKYGVAAVLAMLHDAGILIGAFSVMGHFFKVEVDVLFVTALLTILSFSVHDTIIVFDRIRENVKKHPKVTYAEVVNASILETLGRSINNSMTIIIMLLSLVLIGGGSIHWFAVALLIGAITGTYSSTFTAAPLLVIWDEVAKKRKVHSR